MSHLPECPCGRPRAGCEYHDPAMQPAAPPEPPPNFNLYRWVTECHGRVIEDPPYPANAPKPWARGVGIQGLRLLGPDDPEVSDDLIYIDDAMGGVVGVPPLSARPSFSLWFEGALITVHPEPDATAADVARLIATQVPGARVEADGTITVTRTASDWSFVR